MNKVMDMEQPDNSVKRKRSSNFTATEKESLVNILQKHKEIVECKKTDGATSKEKDNAWNKIAVEFNAQLLVEHRPVEKLLRENLKRSTRKHFSIVRAEKFKTGGGKSAIISTDPIFVRVKGIIDGTCEPLQQKYDSNYLPEIDDIQLSNDEQVQVFLQDDVMEDVRINNNYDNNNNNSTQSEEDVRSMGVSLDRATEDWSSWNLTSLKTPKNNALNINHTEQEASTVDNGTCEERINLRRNEQAKLRKEIGNRFSERSNYKRRSGHLQSFGLLAQAKLEYVTMLKNELIEKSKLEKEVLKTQLIQERLKAELLRKQLEEKKNT